MSSTDVISMDMFELFIFHDVDRSCIFCRSWSDRVDVFGFTDISVIYDVIRSIRM